VGLIDAPQRLNQEAQAAASKAFYILDKHASVVGLTL
jgi:hypothetical protein